MRLQDPKNELMGYRFGLRKFSGYRLRREEQGVSRAGHKKLDWSGCKRRSSATLDCDGGSLKLRRRDPVGSRLG